MSYTARNWVTGCEARIHAFNPSARIIYLMRDPVERAMSHYWHVVQDGREARRPEQAIAGEPAYVDRSRYAMQLEPYIERFGRPHVYAFTLEELRANPRSVLGALFEWLGVDPDIPVRTDRQHNVGARELRQTRRHLMWMDTALKHWRWRSLQARIPFDFTGRVARAISRPVRRSEVDDRQAMAYLRSRLGPTVRDLERLLGRKFPEWQSLH